MNFSKGWRKKIWLLSGSAAMGIGIWAMHFIAMLAFKLPIPISYNITLVIISIIVAIVASLCGLYFICQPKVGNTKVFIGGIFMGLGISGMHYIGMAAMEGVQIIYRPFLFIISILIAIVASVVALMLAFRFRESQKGISNKAKLISGLFMSFAITGMHYTGMAAATFKPLLKHTGSGPYPELDVTAIVTAVSISSIVILGIILVSSFILDQRLSEEIAFKGAILESVLDCVIIINHIGKIMECNPSVFKTFGYSSVELIGQNMEKSLFLHSSTLKGKNSSLLALHDSTILDKRIEVTGIHRDGTEFPVEIIITRIKKEGSPVFTVYARDITEFKNAEATIRQMAYHDILTGLPNRRLFNDYLIESIIEAKKHRAMVAVLFLDLDRFKLINDSMGHAFGDLLLCNVAKRLQECLGDKDVVSRNGGDEFTIILKETTEAEAENKAKQIIHSLVQPFHLEDHEVYVTTSIGVAVYPKDGENNETLIKNADMAMYEAKEQGRNRYSLYQLRNEMNISKQLHLESEMRRALERNEFVVYYQPKLNIDTETIVGVEALVRWNHPERGIISPCEFIPQAEKSGLIVPLGNLVLRTAVAQCKQWCENSLPLQMSVNLSALQFNQPDIVNVISEIINDEKLDPSLLDLEITESMAMDVEYTTKVLKDLKRLGVSISMDDFGTGYSSLSILKRMPIDHIKIDKSFISNINDNKDDAAIVKAIVSMAKSLNMDVIAEGVEDEAQFLLLKGLQCEEMQGYILSPPLPAAEFERFVINFTKTSQIMMS